MLLPANRTGSSTIGPHSNVNLERTIGVIPAELQDIKAGTKKIFVWGGVDYTDAFGGKRHFVFRVVNGNAALINNPGDAALLQPHKLGYDGD